MKIDPHAPRDSCNLFLGTTRGCRNIPGINEYQEIYRSKKGGSGKDFDRLSVFRNIPAFVDLPLEQMDALIEYLKTL